MINKEDIVAWEPLDFDWYDDLHENEDEELLGETSILCTGRGRNIHPTYLEMLRRVPKKAAQQLQQLQRRNQVTRTSTSTIGIGRAQMLRERTIDYTKQMTGSMRSSSSVVSIENHSTVSAPVVGAASPIAHPKPSTQRSRGRGRAKVKPPAPIEYPFAGSRKPVVLPGKDQETEMEEVQRGLHKVGHWLESGFSTVEQIGSAEKEQLKKITKKTPSITDIDRLIEAGGSFMDCPKISSSSERGSSHLSHHRSPLSSSLKVTREENPVLLTSNDMSKSKQEASDSSLQTNIDILQSNSPFASPEVSPIGSPIPMNDKQDLIGTELLQSSSIATQQKSDVAAGNTEAYDDVHLSLENYDAEIRKDSVSEKNKFGIQNEKPDVEKVINDKDLKANDNNYSKKQEDNTASCRQSYNVFDEDPVTFTAECMISSPEMSPQRKAKKSKTEYDHNAQDIENNSKHNKELTKESLVAKYDSGSWPVNHCSPENEIPEDKRIRTASESHESCHPETKQTADCVEADQNTNKSKKKKKKSESVKSSSVKESGNLSNSQESKCDTSKLEKEKSEISTVPPVEEVSKCDKSKKSPVISRKSSKKKLSKRGKSHGKKASSISPTLSRKSASKEENSVVKKKESPSKVHEKKQTKELSTSISKTTTSAPVASQDEMLQSEFKTVPSAHGQCVRISPSSNLCNHNGSLELKPSEGCSVQEVQKVVLSNASNRVVNGSTLSLGQQCPSILTASSSDSPTTGQSNVSLTSSQNKSSTSYHSAKQSLNPANCQLKQQSTSTQQPKQIPSLMEVSLPHYGNAPPMFANNKLHYSSHRGRRPAHNPKQVNRESLNLETDPFMGFDDNHDLYVDLSGIEIPAEALLETVNPCIHKNTSLLRDINTEKQVQKDEMSKSYVQEVDGDANLYLDNNITSDDPIYKNLNLTGNENIQKDSRVREEKHYVEKCEVEEEQAGICMITNVPADRESCELIRDMVRHFGDLTDYVEEETDVNRMKVTVWFKEQISAIEMQACFHGNESLFEGCTLAAYDLSP